MGKDVNALSYRPIGVIRSPFTEPGEGPVQPRYAKGAAGTVEVFAEFADGLLDLEGFSHIVLLFHFHRARPAALRLVPFLDDQERGVFATRAPRRPNPIGMSVVRLVRREGTTLFIENVDALDGTPLLDIKPHVPRFGVDGPVRGGWHDAIDESLAAERGWR